MTLKGTIVLVSITGYSLALYHRENSDDEPMRVLDEIPTFLSTAGATADAHRPNLQNYEPNDSNGSLII